MNKIEQMHFDAILWEEVGEITQDGDFIKCVEEKDYSSVAIKSAQITKQIALEFVKWCNERNKEVEDLITWDDYYKEFIKRQDEQDRKPGRRTGQLRS